MVLESKALQINLEATAVDQLEYAPRYKVLREAVKDYQGVLKAADHLLFELHHPYRNWPVVIGELRAFALKNLATYSRSNRGVESIAVIITTFLDIIDEAPKKEHKVQAVEGLMAFLEKLVQTLEPEILSDLEKTLTGTFQKLYTGSDSVIEALITSFHPFPRLVRNLAGKLDDCSGSSRLWQVSGDLMKRLRKATIRYWLSQPGPVKWLDRTLEQYGSRLEISDLDRIKELLAPVSHSRFEQYMEEIGTLKTRESGFHTVRDLLEMPGHLDIVRNYRQIAHAIGNLSCNISASAEKGDSHTPYEIDLQLLFLFHLLEIDGLAGIHEEILRQINRSLVCKVRTAEINQLKTVLPKSFDLLKQHIGHFPRTALQCIETLGNEIFRRSNQGLMELFLDQVINFGFQTPGIRGVDSEWHILSNPAHLQNIRVWLNIIGHKPKVCSNLLSALLVYLRLGGTCIRDTDLFQKDVTRLLNCDIGPVYNMVKQLAKILPVYFNEIGAEGLLRDVSTELDEISHRKDILIHFLRKQSHVESNNLIVDFIQAIFCFWYSRQKDRLKPFLPPEILGQIPAHGPYVEHVHRLIRHLAVTLGLEPFARHIKQILNISDEHLALILDQVSDVPPHEKKRLKLLIRMFRLETLKYELGTQEIRHHLEEAQNYGFHGLDEVIEAIERDDPEECLNVILEKLEELKKIILSPDKFEIHESIYHKRHIAADIPSMYGRYHEKKFDALSLTYRLENLANVYFERLSASLDVPFITKAIFVRIVKCLRLFWRAIQLNEVHSKKFATYLTLLEKSLDLRRFTFSQYLDIVRGLSDGVKDMIYVYYIGPHQD
ncbi:MAG TPA: phosphoenolpyruvate synthase, partial [Thermodesulfobacteriaceae bacterium]|nr:phosphoenolpyruvate synthase [Thermodesulfobacteriaceae bacterium]